MKNTYFFIFGILLNLVFFKTGDAANCYGGQYTSGVIGGYYTDNYYDVAHVNNEIYAVGRSGSYDFPYDDGTFPYTSPYPDDALISFGGVPGYQFLLCGTGNEQATSVYVEGDYLCVGGTTDYASFFPSYGYATDWSVEGNYGDPYFAIFNRTSHELLFSEVYGDDFDTFSVHASLSTKRNLVALVSDAAPNLSAKKSWASTDVRITLFNMTGGNAYEDAYYGSYYGDDYPVASGFFEKSGKLYLMVAGYTYSYDQDFPVLNAFQNFTAGSSDGFVWLFDVTNVSSTNQSQMVFGTFFGGGGNDQIGDAVFDESGNIYIVGRAGGNLPMKNAFDSQLCDESEGGNCVFLSVFNLQGNLLFSSYVGLNNSNAGGVSVQRLTDGGHLVYITGSSSNTDTFPSVESFDRTFNQSESSNYQDAFVTIVYIAADFKSGEIRFSSIFGSEEDDFASAVTFLPNNSFAIVGSTYGNGSFPGAEPFATTDYYYQNAFVTTFQCGSGLYGLNPSPTPVASIAPSSPPATCQSSNGCYQSTGVVVQFEEGDDGEYIPSQTVYPEDNDEIIEEYYLNVKYLSLEERDSNGQLVVSVPFPSAGYEVQSEEEVINGVNVDVVTFTTYLQNGAQIDVFNYLFEEAGTMNFAGTTVAVAEGTSKVSLKISGWSFEDTANTLTLTILLNIAPEPQGPATQVASGNQTQFSWDTGATDCRVTTVSNIEIDNGIGTSNFSATSSKLLVTFPYFEYSVLYDPGYAVLVKDDKKSSPKEDISPWAYVGAALGAVVVVSAAVGAGYFVMSKQKRKTAKALSYRPNDVESVEMK